MSDLIYKALRIRMVEEKIIELYPTDLIQSPVHLSIGQESVAVGFCENLLANDWLFINYRGHAFYLAKGGPLPEFFAELMGRRTGLSKGKAGSMHLASPKHGVIGASAVVGSTISHAVGAAMASRIRGETNKIFVVNFGDGAMEQGVFHESMNFAALHRLPVLFLCEDNGLAVHASLNERQAFCVPDLISAYGIPFFDIREGYDPTIVMDKSNPVINMVREKGAPAFLRIKTMRYQEHVGPGQDYDAGYRDNAEISEWKSLDPLLQSTEEIQHFKSLISKEIDSAVSFALDSPYPDHNDLLTDVI